MTFVRNCWYCAGWSTDLGVRPVRRTFLAEEVVLFRDSKGEAKALAGTCPHRFAPLSRGKVVGDNIQCGYHGLEFDGSGLCVLNPHGSGTVPPGTRVRSHPLIERHGALWLWMGDSALADEANIPAFDFLCDTSRWSSTSGHILMDVSYELLIDNLLDLTHATYIHPDTLGVERSGSATMHYDFAVEDDVIQSKYLFRNVPPTPLFSLLTEESSIDLDTVMSLHPASNLLLNIAIGTSGREFDEAIWVPSAHLLTPESETRCHYFFAVGRSSDLDNVELTRQMGEIVLRAFADEDAPMIRACQSGMKGKDFWSLKPVVLETDIAAVQARRMLKKLLQQEQQHRVAAS